MTVALDTVPGAPPFPEIDRARSNDKRPIASVLRPGERVDGTPYIVVDQIGRGGMGEVYEVEHEDLGRRCALKVLRACHVGRHDLVERMNSEARSLAALRHPNLVDVFDMGMTLGGLPYFAMELLRGRDLRSELSRFGVLSVPTALGLVTQALEGLGAAHAAGIVHRDVKLENLFLCDDGALKILDFGVAKVLRSDGPTRHDRVLGTPRTMAPEQCSAARVDPRTDLYAAGLVLYELLAGRGPFDDLNGNFNALRFAHCRRTPPAPSMLSPQTIPRGIEEAIMKAIAKAPDERFQSAAEMADALRVLSGERRRRSSCSPFGPRSPDASSRELVPSVRASIFLGIALSVLLGFILGRELPRTPASAEMTTKSAQIEAKR